MGDKWTTSGAWRLKAKQKHTFAARASTRNAATLQQPGGMRSRRPTVMLSSAHRPSNVDNPNSHPSLRKYGEVHGSYSTYADPLARRAIGPARPADDPNANANSNHPVHPNRTLRRIRDASNCRRSAATRGRPSHPRFAPPTQYQQDYQRWYEQQQHQQHQQQHQHQQHWRQQQQHLQQQQQHPHDYLPSPTQPNYSPEYSYQPNPLPPFFGQHPHDSNELLPSQQESFDATFGHSVYFDRPGPEPTTTTPVFTSSVAGDGPLHPPLHTADYPMAPVRNVPWGTSAPEGWMACATAATTVTHMDCSNSMNSEHMFQAPRVATTRSPSTIQSPASSLQPGRGPMPQHRLPQRDDNHPARRSPIPTNWLSFQNRPTIQDRSFDRAWGGDDSDFNSDSMFLPQDCSGALVPRQRSFEQAYDDETDQRRQSQLRRRQHSPVPPFRAEPYDDTAMTLSPSGGLNLPARHRSTPVALPATAGIAQFRLDNIHGLDQKSSAWSLPSPWMQSQPVPPLEVHNPHALATPFVRAKSSFEPPLVVQGVNELDQDSFASAFVEPAGLARFQKRDTQETAEGSVPLAFTDQHSSSKQNEGKDHGAGFAFAAALSSDQMDTGTGAMATTQTEAPPACSIEGRSATTNKVAEHSQAIAKPKQHARPASGPARLTQNESSSTPPDHKPTSRKRLVGIASQEKRRLKSEPSRIPLERTLNVSPVQIVLPRFFNEGTEVDQENRPLKNASVSTTSKYQQSTEKAKPGQLVSYRTGNPPDSEDDLDLVGTKTLWGSK